MVSCFYAFCSSLWYVYFLIVAAIVNAVLSVASAVNIGVSLMPHGV